MNKLLEQINKTKKINLGNVSHYVTNKIDASELSLDDYISTENMLSERGGITQATKLPNGGKVTKFKQGDTLTSNIRPYFKKIWQATKDGGCSNDVLVIRTNNPKELDENFLYYNISNDVFFAYSMMSSQGTKMPRGDKDAIMKYEILFPDLPTQKKIASILSAYDAKIENNNLIIKKLEATAQTLFDEWFVNFRFPGHEKVKFIDSEMGEIPEGWEISSLGEISNNHDSKRIPLSSMERAKRKGKIPYYGANGVLDYIDESIFSGEYILFAEDGTVKTDKGTPVIYLLDADFWVNNHAHIISGKSVSNYYIYLSLRTINVDPYITGGVQPKITQQNLNSIPVIVPDNEIKKRFEVFISSIFRKIRMAEKENVSLKSQRDLLLIKLI